MTNWESVLVEAHNAAKEAVIAEVAREPENPHAFDCGFAWVTIPRTHPLATHCRTQRNRLDGDTTTQNRGARLYGDKGYPRGVAVVVPGRVSWAIGPRVASGRCCLRRIPGNAWGAR